MVTALGTIPVVAVGAVVFVIVLLIVLVLWAVLSKGKSSGGGGGAATPLPQGYYPYPPMPAARVEELKVGPAINVLAEQAEQIEKQINTTVGFLGRAQKWQGWVASDVAAAPAGTVAPAPAAK